MCMCMSLYIQLYGAATMNNTLCLAVFAALVYFRDLNWQFSAGGCGVYICLNEWGRPFLLYIFCACTIYKCMRIFVHFVCVRNIVRIISFTEVTVTLLIEYAVGITVIVAGFAFKHTYPVC